MIANVNKLTLSKKFFLFGKYCLSAIVSSLMVFSCTLEEATVPDPCGCGEEREIIFSMNVPGINEATPQLRSIDLTQENTIKTIDLVAFRKEGGNTHFNYYYSGTLATGNTPGASSQSCRVKVRLADYEQEFVIITNAGTAVSDLVAKTTQSTAKEDFLANLVYTLPKAGDSWNAVSASNYTALPMWGETIATVDQSTDQLSVSLLRMLAKIDVQLDQTRLSQLRSIFKIKSVSVYNTNTNGRIAPNSAAVVRDNSNNVQVNAPSLPATPVKYLGPLVYKDFTAPGTPDVAMKGAIYTFETKQPDISKPLSALDATCVVIGGIYDKDTRETFYRVDFLKDEKFQDILRNHRYLVNIVSVTGSGYNDPDEAYRNQAVNMDVNILEWDENNMHDVTFDGQWYLSVSDDSISVSRDGEVDNELTVLTDYTSSVPSESGWHVVSITDDATGKDCTWVNVTPRQGAPNELKNVQITAEVNTTGKYRSATILFEAGRLRYPVKIYQSNISKPKIIINEWFPGTSNPIGSLITGDILFKIQSDGSTVPSVQGIRITIEPADVDEMIIYRKAIQGVKYAAFDFSPDITGLTVDTLTNVQRETMIGPHPGFDPAYLVTEPNYLREEEIIIEVTYGPYTITRSLILKHAYIR